MLFVKHGARFLFWRWALLATLLSLCSVSHAERAFSFSPVTPTLLSGESSTALWLENQGTDVLAIQIQVLARQQVNFEDVYQAQEQVVVSPPFVQVAPGTKQLVRILYVSSEPRPVEQVFRIVMDEIPLVQASEEQPNQGALRFQFRHLIPLFVFGQDAWIKDPVNPTGKGEPLVPSLHYTFQMEGATQFLVVHNQSPIHARMLGIFTQDAQGQTVPVIENAMGYILPNATMRWALPKEFKAIGASAFWAKINFEEALVPMTLQP